MYDHAIYETLPTYHALIINIYIYIAYQHVILYYILKFMLPTRVAITISEFKNRTSILFLEKPLSIGLQ